MTCTIGGMGLTCKEEDDGALWIVHNLTQTVQIGEEQMGSLVGSKAAAEANDQRIRVEVLSQLRDT